MSDDRSLPCSSSNKLWTHFSPQPSVLHALVSVKLQCYNESNITLKFRATHRQRHVSMSNANHGLDYNITFCCLESTPSNLAEGDIFCMRLNHRRKSNSLWSGVASALISDIQGRVCIRSAEACNTVRCRSNVRQSANIKGQCRYNSDLHVMRQIEFFYSPERYMMPKFGHKMWSLFTRL